jgi:hypothetical protein
MRIQVAVPEEHVDPHVIDAALEAVTRLDESLIRAGQSPTSHELVEKGAKLRPEPMGDEHFDHGATIASRGWGDCDDWAPLHAATLRTSGVDPGARARIVPSGPSTFHAMVETSDGRLLQGEEDISVMAGMRPIAHKVVGSGPDAGIDVQACDPHDGRLYAGSLLPTVGPLNLHCGPQFTVRGCHLHGGRKLFEGRCDIPLSGSPLVGARHRHRRRVRGAMPYALSSTSLGYTPHAALSAAIVGAVLCGDAAELATSADRYKLVAMQCKLSGMRPVDIHAGLSHRIVAEAEQEAAAMGVGLEDVFARLGAEVGTPPDPHLIATAVTDAAVRADLKRVIGF